MRIGLFTWRVLPVMLALFVLAGPVSLQADAVAGSYTFSFSGTCEDCVGPGPDGAATATLMLQGYTLGDQIIEDNLVSFVYDPTDRLPAGFTIAAGDPLNALSGMFPSLLAGFADFSIHSGHGPTFDSDSAGNWYANIVDDRGTQGLWNGSGAVDVPEPGAFLLMAGGMALLGVRRWIVRN